MRNLIPIVAAASYALCTGIYTWGTDEAGAVIGSALPNGLRHSMDLLSVIFQPWVLLPYSLYHGNSIWFLFVVEVVSAVILWLLLRLLRNYRRVYLGLIAVFFLASPFLAWAGIRSYQSAWEYNHNHTAG